LIVHDLCEFYASRAEQERIHFNLVAADDLLLIRGEVTYLQLAIENLLENALKFTPAAGEIELGTARQGRDAILWVEDTGLGIPNEDLPLIFDRFYRGQNVSEYPGSGLGLSLVQGIVERYNGRIEVWSEGGRTRFTLFFPLCTNG
jgi:signal transduction histidine kinase